MDGITTALQNAFGEVAQYGPELIAAFVTFLVCLGIGRALAEGLSRVLSRGSQRNSSSRLLNRLVRGGFGLIGLVLGLQILGLTAVATSLLATGGLVAVILGFAFREIGENLLAGLFLGVSRSFEVGDLIECSGHVGEVRDIELRQVWIRSADGRDIFIPSAQIFRSPLVNYTRDSLRRAEFVIGIDYADSVADARQLLLAETLGVEQVLREPPAVVRVSEFTPQYCELKVFFWVNTDVRPGLAEVRSLVMTACLEALQEKGFTLSSDVSNSVVVSYPEAPITPESRTPPDGPGTP
jgi:small-conductance mechanosensitive channel